MVLVIGSDTICGWVLLREIFILFFLNLNVNLNLGKIAFEKMTEALKNTDARNQQIIYQPTN